jgi:hypothetical protein
MSPSGAEYITQGNALTGYNLIHISPVGAKYATITKQYHYKKCNHSEIML